ncbi:MAG TPA: glycosyltransferase family 87 protein [Candidatus Baltobacteraceae bacterium]|nr:glycosyltransferase family 87 protein [Candidatus Baltobacteraceae bacterium]
MTRNVFLALACALIVIGITIARPERTPGPLQRDFEAYWSAGATFNAGKSPYGRAIWDAERTVPGVDPTHDEMLPFISPPSTLLIWSALARLPFDPATRVWYGVLLCALVGLIVASLRGSGEPVTFFSFCATLALAVGFGPVTSNLALGQIAITAFLGATVATTARSWPVKTLASFVALFQPNVALGLVSQLGRNITTLAILAAAACGYLCGALLVGLAWPIRYVSFVWSHAAGERYGAIQYTPAAVAYGLHWPPPLPELTSVLLACAAALAAIVAWRRLENGFARFAAFSALTPFVATFFHDHDFVVAFPAAVWCALRTRGTDRTIGLAGALLVSIDWFGLAQRTNAIPQSAFLVAGAAAAFLALGEEFDLRRTAHAAVPVAVLFVTGAWLGSGHPAPVWPYTLGSFHAPASASIATIWFLEQRQSGLEAAIPSWALLKSLSLLGCALLFIAVTATARAIYPRSPQNTSANATIPVGAAE